MISLLLLLLVASLLSACAAQKNVENAAKTHGFQRTIVNSGKFRHLVYSHHVSKRHAKVLHVYLEGDGNPWLRPHIISVDPTGRTPFMLNLMAIDSRPSVYLGRPCYHGFYQDENCSPLLWTHARYAPIVIDSMVAVLNKIMRRYQTDELYLIGYSGGGVLAMLLAERLKQVKKVITIAANLDIAAWTKQHNYSPLQSSLNPATRLDLYSDLPQLHLAGRQDDNVALRIIESFVSQQNKPYIKLGIYDQFDHKCCWLNEWPKLVGKIEEFTAEVN